LVFFSLIRIFDLTVENTIARQNERKIFFLLFLCSLIRIFATKKRRSSFDAARK